MPGTNGCARCSGGSVECRGEAAQQADAADEAFGGMAARLDMPPHARAGRVGRGHRFAADPQCYADTQCAECGMRWPLKARPFGAVGG